MNKKGIAVWSCILAMSIAGGAYGATSVQGGLGSNTGHSDKYSGIRNKYTEQFHSGKIYRCD